MEEKDKWKDNIRNRMADYSEPVPAGLWGQLEKELDVPPRVIPMWRRWQSVAAVALVMFVSSLAVWFWHVSSADYIEQQTMKITALPQSAPMAPVPGIAARPQAKEMPVAAPMAQAGGAKKRLADVVAEPVVAVEMPVEAQTEEQVEVQAEKQVERKKEEPVPEPRAAYNPAARKKSNYYAYVAPGKKKETNWSIGLSAGNSPFSATNGYGGYTHFRSPAGGRSLYEMVPPHDPVVGSLPSVLPSYPAGTKEYAYNQILMNNLSEESVNSDIEHKMPVTFGASLRFDLNSKWAVETGLVYTLLSSDLRSGGKDSYYVQEQRLHYVGIPLKVSRNIWENRRFEVYASAGGAVEKCVSGNLHTTYVVGESDKANEDENIHIKPLQWSLSASAGAQFKITEKVGVYAEPGVVYYFDDGSDASTIRKEHPFNFNIQLGLRFTLPK